MASEAARVKGSSKANAENAVRKTLKESSLRSAIRRWDRMTDENEHSKVRVSISKYFGYDDLHKSYSDIYKEHERAGRLTHDLYERRSSLDDELRKRLTRDYGESVRRRVL